MDRQGRQTARAWMKSKLSSSFEEMMRSSSSGRKDQSDDVCCSLEDSCSFETLSERRDVFFSVAGSVVLAGCFDFTTQTMFDDFFLGAMFC